MIKVKVNFMTVLGELIGIQEPIIELPDGSTFSELMQYIRKTYGPKFPESLFKDGKFHYIHLILNNRDIYEDKHGDRVLEDGDVLYFIPPVGGG